jgi:hypothetical protein
VWQPVLKKSAMSPGGHADRKILTGWRDQADAGNAPAEAAPIEMRRRSD